MNRTIQQANSTVHKVEFRLMGVLLVLQVVGHKPKYWTTFLKFGLMLAWEKKTGDHQSHYRSSSKWTYMTYMNICIKFQGNSPNSCRDFISNQKKTTDSQVDIAISSGVAKKKDYMSVHSLSLWYPMCYHVGYRKLRDCFQQKVREESAVCPEQAVEIFRIRFLY